MINKTGNCHPLMVIYFITWITHKYYESNISSDISDLRQAPYQYKSQSRLKMFFIIFQNKQRRRNAYSHCKIFVLHYPIKLVAALLRPLLWSTLYMFKLHSYISEKKILYKNCTTSPNFMK